MAIGSDGLPVISYHDITAGALKVAKCANAACSPAGSATITTLDDPPANAVAFTNAIAIGSDGFPVISYTDETAGTLKVAKCSNIACSPADTVTITTIVDPPASEVGASSIAIGGDGLPVISYAEYFSDNGTLNVVKCGNAACTGATLVSTVDDPLRDVGSFSSIAVGSDGLPIISYRDDGAGAFLKVAKCGSKSCQ